MLANNNWVAGHTWSTSSSLGTPVLKEINRTTLICAALIGKAENVTGMQDLLGENLCSLHIHTGADALTLQTGADAA